MIVIDRTASTPISDQITDQLRYQIAIGRYGAGEHLPSTRALADQLGVSFHTIRKVYRALVSDGVLEAREGRAFVVLRQTPIGKERRMERGAEIASDALMRMTALGLSDSEISYLFDEQRSLLEASSEQPKIVMAASYLELAERCAEQLVERVQREVEASRTSDLSRHSDADYILAPYGDLRDVLRFALDADVTGVEIGLGSEVLDIVARLPGDHTLGVLVRDVDAVRPVVESIRESTGFPGDVIAVTVEDDTIELIRRLKDCAVVVVSPGVRRRIPGTLRKEKRLVTIDGRLTEESLARVRAILPR